MDFQVASAGALASRATLDASGNLALTGDLQVNGGNVDINKQGTLAQLQMTTAEVVVGPKIVGRESLGTLAAPTAIAANYALLRIAGRGYGATAWSGDVALIDFAPAQNFTDAAHGTKMNFYTTPLNNAAAVLAMTLGPDKSLTVGADTDTLNVFGRAKVGYFGVADEAGIAHYDHMSLTGLALRQNAAGDTVLNAPTGRGLCLRINNAGGLMMSAAALYPAAAGGMTLGTPTKEWGNAYFGSDKYLYFGDAQQASIHYDNAESRLEILG